MKELNLKLTGSNAVSSVFIDGKSVRLKRNKFNSLETNYTTDKDCVEVVILRQLELKSRIWFLMAMIFFVISIFGILDPPYDRKFIAINCKFKINLKETNKVVVAFNNSSNAKAVDIKSDCEVEVIENSYYIDEQVKKRYKILIGAKILLWIALIITLIFVLKKYL